MMGFSRPEDRCGTTGLKINFRKSIYFKNKALKVDKVDFLWGKKESSLHSRDLPACLVNTK